MKMNNILAEPVSYIAFFFVLGLMPLALVMLTSFTKISIVLSLLRNALGVQQVPSNLVIAGLSLAATMVIMQPVAQQIMRTGEIEKMMRGRAPVSVTAIIEGASEPVRTFLRRHAKSEERDFFLKALQVQQKDESRQDDDFSVLVPAFVISEIGRGVRNRLFTLPGLCRDRPGRRQHPDGHGNVDVLAHRGVHSAQAAGVRHGGRATAADA
jgi:type III secretion protein R